MNWFGSRARALIVASAIALVARPGTAQEVRGRIIGVVSDNTGAVLPGVSVTVAGPALIRPQTTTTSAEGSYRYPALAPGVYALTFELSGFQTLKREGIRLGLNTTLTIDAELQIATLAETVMITRQSPVVDIKSTTIGTNFAKELLQDIPNARDLWAAMAQAPGFQMTGYDVGGSHTGTQTGFQTYGVSGQNKTLLEGINVTEGSDSNAGYFDFGSFEEMQFGGSGNMGEQSGLGAFINSTVKSGGDKLAAQVYYDRESDTTISNNAPNAFRTPGGTDPRVGSRRPRSAIR